MSSTWRNTSHIDSTIFYAEADLNDAVFRVPPPTDSAVLDNANLVETINTAVAAGGGEVRFAAGTYLFTAAAPEVGAGGSFSAGTVVGLKFTGGGRGVTVLNFAPTASTFLFTVGDGVLSSGLCSFSDFTVILGNANAAGAFWWRDPCNFNVLQRVQVIGNSTAAGIGLLLSGQVSSNADHVVQSCSFRNLTSAIRLSGFANSSLFEEIWMGVVAKGIHYEHYDGDTLSGNQNVWNRIEINGSTTTGIYLRDAAVRNSFIDVVTDGPTAAMDAATGCINNTFVGCTIPIATTTLTGTSATNNTWIACNSRGSDAVAQELRLGDTRLFRSTTTTVTLGSGSDGLSAANLVNYAGDTKAPSFRVTDGAGADLFQIASSGTNLILKNVSGNTFLTVSNASRPTWGTTQPVVLPIMTSTVRDALSSPPDGSLIYNSTTSKAQIRAGATWVDLH